MEWGLAVVAGLLAYIASVLFDIQRHLKQTSQSKAIREAKMIDEIKQLRQEIEQIKAP